MPIKPSEFPRVLDTGSPVFTNPLNKLQGGVLRLEAVDPLWVRRHLLRLEHQEVAPPPLPLNALLLPLNALLLRLHALLLPPLPPARRGRVLLWLFFEAAKLRAKLLRVLAQRQTPAAQHCRELLLRAWRLCLF